MGAKYSVSGDAQGLTLSFNEAASEIAALRIVTIGSGNRIVIGERCLINAYIYVAHGATVAIGDNTRMNGLVAIHAHEGSSVDIGSHCLFSNSVVLRPSDAHKILDISSGERLNEPKPINVGNRVWIAEHVSILKGARIPDDCVIATRAVVSKAFSEANCVLAGNPARIVRRGIVWKP